MSSTFPNLLVVEESPTLAEAYAQLLAAEPVAVRCAGSLAEARAAVAAERPAAILLDLNLPDGNGISLLRELQGADADIVVIVMTAHGSINTAVEAMQAGADDFILKPFAKERLITTLRNSLERRRLSRVIEALALVPGELPMLLPEPQRAKGGGALASAAAAPERHRNGAAAAARRDAIRPLELVEREAIERAIATCDGNMTEAAQYLGISVKTIYRKRRSWLGERA